MAVYELLTSNPKPWLQIKANTLELTGGLTLANSGGLPSSLNYYEELNYTTQMSGPWTASQSILIRLTRIGRTVICTSFADVTGTFSAPALASLVTPIPARFRPFSATLRQYTHIVDNGTGFQSHADITSGGNIIIGKDGAQFTGGVCTVLVFSYTWTI